MECLSVCRHVRYLVVEWALVGASEVFSGHQAGVGRYMADLSQIIRYIRR